MATPKEQHDASAIAAAKRARAKHGEEPTTHGSAVAPPKAEEQGDGQPENDQELRDTSNGEARKGKEGTSATSDAQS
jgi:hypothetical protein